MSNIIFALLVDTPMNILYGLYEIIISPDLLITDYTAVGGLGSAFFNAGLLTLISVFILYLLKINISGVSIASILLMTGFALFGKNIFNIWLILLGVLLYAKLQKEKFSKYIYIALFGTSMAPTITEIIFHFDKPLYFRLTFGILIGVLIGLILPPLSSYLLKVHQGYNLYNIGFTAGIISTVFVSIFKSYGFLPKTRMLWSTSYDLPIIMYLSTIFALLIISGYYINNKSFSGFINLFSYSGRLITDFVVLEGFGVTLINMGLNGFVSMAYLLLVRGNFNGPTVGGILTIVGFSAFGKHAKNIIPIFLGVFLGSLTKIWAASDPSILLAALFGTALAPISGQYGWKYGVLAGFINSSVVLNVGILHGGLNLYNTGFSAGIVAAFLIPIIEAFRKEK